MLSRYALQSQDREERISHIKHQRRKLNREEWTSHWSLNGEL